MPNNLFSSKINVPYNTVEAIERPRLYDIFRDSTLKRITILNGQ